MDINVVSFSLPSPKLPRSVLATARVEITCDSVHKITLDDLRILQNSRSELWIAMPSQKNAQGVYIQTVELSSQLKRMLTDVLIPAYEKWSLGQTAQSPDSTVQGGAR
jgi:DNA-binding cell septation regulator SpoVG